MDSNHPVYCNRDTRQTALERSYNKKTSTFPCWFC
nr:MAG TPA: Microprocessor complex subunit [Caudoviricetes sp.]